MLEAHTLWKVHKMKCDRCDKKMKIAKMRFNSHQIDGGTCSCGQRYYHPEQAERILLLNKLKKQDVIAKLGRIRSNLILRLPKDVEVALGLQEGENVHIRVEGSGFRIVQTH